MPLQHKYRPTNWDEVRGNKDAVEALGSVVGRDTDKPHVYLITGPAGTGKTTLARLIKEDLLCDDTNYKVIEPGKGGVEMVRELKRTVRLKPFGGCPVRLWHLEECHRLTPAAREDLLPLLEEPPEHAFFTLTTTEPEGLKAAFRRRLHECELKPLTDAEIQNLISGIWKEEIDDGMPEGLLTVLVQNALGSPGMALKLLDEVIDLDPDAMADAVARKASEANQSIELCRLLIKKAAWKQIAPVLKGLQGEDPERVRRHVMAYAQSVLLGGRDDAKAGLVLTTMRDNPTFNSGWAGLVATVYEIVA